MKNKTLLILFWDLGIGGIQKRIRDVVNEVSHNRNDWNIYVLLRNKTDEGFTSQLIQRKNVHILYYPWSASRVRLRGAFLAWLLVKYAVIRPDSFLVFLPLLSVLSVVVKSCIFWVKSRLIINEGVVLSYYLSIRGMLWMRFVIQFVYNASDQIIVPTTACRDDLISTFRVIDSKILVIPNWNLLVSKKNLKSDYDMI